MQYRRRDSLVRLYELSKRFIDQLLKEMEDTRKTPSLGGRLCLGRGRRLPGLSEEQGKTSPLCEKGGDAGRHLRVSKERNKMREGIKYWVLGTVGFWAVILLASWSWWV